jgi:uncharacterized protein (DUF58 family)
MKWFLGLLLLLLAALALQSGLLAYSAYVLLALLVISRYLASRWIAGLSASRVCRLDGTDEETAPVGLGPPGGKEDRPTGLAGEIGDRVRVRLTVRNEGTLPVLWVLLEDLLPAAAERRPQRLKVKGKRVQVRMLRPRATIDIRYQVECLARGYYPIGPLVVETGDLFGLHRRYRVAAGPTFVLVYPRVVPLTGYDLASRRPIGDVRLTHRLYEDPTRIAGVRPYEPGDPLNRVHWRATARTGALHSKIQEPSTLAGATVMLDFHAAGYPSRREPFRSELAVVTAVSLANAVCEMNQQVGLVTNGRDAADRIRLEGLHGDDPRTRQDAHAVAPMSESSSRLEPLIVPTRRGVEQLQRIREVLARVELTDGLTFAQLVIETTPRLPRDATVVAVLPEVPHESAIALGNLRRRGLAVTVVLVLLDEDALEAAYARLVAEGIRDLRHLANEEELPDLCRRQVQRSAPYDFATLGG